MTFVIELDGMDCNLMRSNYQMDGLSSSHPFGNSCPWYVRARSGRTLHECNQARSSPLLIINNGDYGAKCSSYRDLAVLPERITCTSLQTFGQNKFNFPNNIRQSKEL